MSIDPAELNQWVGLFLGQFSPAVDGNYHRPMSIIADCHIKAFANYIASLPNEAAKVEQPQDEDDCLPGCQKHLTCREPK
jgi:hypothetical protein